jgi:protein tyrosine phosphatase (PTP) superfamily phosphohydrolase (DUF442 family)
MSLTNRFLITLMTVGLPVFAGSAPGIENFDKVDTNVYRGAQPSGPGFQYLAKIGVKVIIDLRETDARSKAEEQVVTGAGMKYVNVPMTGLTPPTEAEITKILGILEDKTAGPVFVHCHRGADRTGVVIAAYHINHDNWDNARALKDAKAHSMSFFQKPRQKYIKTFRARTVVAAEAPAKTAPAAVAPAAAPAPSVN